MLKIGAYWYDHMAVYFKGNHAQEGESELLKHRNGNQRQLSVQYRRRRTTIKECRMKHIAADHLAYVPIWNVCSIFSFLSSKVQQILLLFSCVISLVINGHKLVPVRLFLYAVSVMYTWFVDLYIGKLDRCCYLSSDSTWKSFNAGTSAEVLSPLGSQTRKRSIILTLVHVFILNFGGWNSHWIDIQLLLHHLNWCF